MRLRAAARRQAGARPPLLHRLMRYSRASSIASSGLRRYGCAIDGSTRATRARRHPPAALRPSAPRAIDAADRCCWTSVCFRSTCRPPTARHRALLTLACGLRTGCYARGRRSFVWGRTTRRSYSRQPLRERGSCPRRSLRRSRPYSPPCYEATCCRPSCLHMPITRSPPTEGPSREPRRRLRLGLRRMSL